MTDPDCRVRASAILTREEARQLTTVGEDALQRSTYEICIKRARVPDTDHTYWSKTSDPFIEVYHCVDGPEAGCLYKYETPMVQDNLSPDWGDPGACFTMPCDQTP